MEAKLADKNDFEHFFKLKCDQNNIYWSGHATSPDKKGLQDWFLININRSDRYFFLFFSEDKMKEVIGYLYLDIVGDNKDTIDTGHGVHSNYAGQGYGTMILKYGIQYAKDKLPSICCFQGWIMSDNIGSVKNVLKLGYQKTEENKLITTEKGEEKLMEKYLLIFS